MGKTVQRISKKRPTNDVDSKRTVFQSVKSVELVAGYVNLLDQEVNPALTTQHSDGKEKIDRIACYTRKRTPNKDVTTSRTEF